jgi:hypothetical protein
MKQFTWIIAILIALLTVGCGKDKGTQVVSMEPAITLSTVTGLSKVSDINTGGYVTEGTLNLGKVYKSASRYFVVNNNSDSKLFNVVFKSSDPSKVEVATDTLAVLGVPGSSTSLVPLLQLAVRHGTSGIHVQADPYLWDGLIEGGQNIQLTLTITWSTESTKSVTDSVQYFIALTAMIVNMIEVDQEENWLVVGNCTVTQTNPNSAAQNKTSLSWSPGDTIHKSQLALLKNEPLALYTKESCLNLFPTNAWFSVY